ncbi:MAG: carotenoid 1,2-hydratase [Planctomycetes bacterium]|nr:carotenoid 1,2-hydratase [Planctomycetota bacterium]
MMIARLTTICVLTACAMSACAPRQSARAIREPLSITDVLRGTAADDAGYARAVDPRAFAFPADHGPHPDFRSEWWYFTGNLTSADGRRFGYHLTFFRNAVTPVEPAVEHASAWRTRQVWMAHFALADVAGGRVHASERFGRGALDLAGARAEPFRVWLDDWSVIAEPDGDGVSALRLRAATDDGVTLDLRLDGAKPLVLQGDAGLSRKSSTPGNASYYYSVPRFSAAGTITVGEGAIAVHGSGWFDREWSTSALDAGQVGWDWFALQLEDGAELMLYRIRRADGSSDPASEGTLITPDGGTRRLAHGEFSLAEERSWRSPRSGASYPVAWLVTVPSLGLRLRVTAALDDQELDLAFRYWEGAVDVHGSRADSPLGGVGYLEMTGYADAARAGG